MPTTRRTRSLGFAALAFALLAGTLLPATLVHADDLPFKAYGAGRASGEVVRALKGSTVLAETTVNAQGQWQMNIPAGGSANVANGDSVGFTVDGKAANEKVTFVIGQFVPPPGLTLTTSAAPATATATPAPTATAAPTGTTGVLANMPTFAADGKALAVFNTGTVDQLTSEGVKVKATGIWVQDSSGAFRLLLIGGPAFINDQFRASFSGGFGVTSVLLVK